MIANCLFLIPDSLHHADETHIFPDIVHAHHAAAAFYRKSCCSKRSFHTLIYRQIKCQTDHGLTACSKQYRIPHLLKERQMIKDPQVLFIALCKADSRI